MVLMGVVGAVKCVLDDFWQGLRQRRRRYATPCLILLLAVRWLVWCFLCEVLIIYNISNYSNLDYYPRLEEFEKFESR